MKKPFELINQCFPDCSSNCAMIDCLGAGECESVCPSKFDKLMCADCSKCFNGCLESFPEKFINGGASKCEGFDKEVDEERVWSNLKRKEKEIMKKYAEAGYFV